MIPAASRAIDARDHLLPQVPIPLPDLENLADNSVGVELSPKLRADLLDFDAWSAILTTYGRTMRVAVALTDPQGLLLGKCHNPQPVWRLVQEASISRGNRCPFCLTTKLPCAAVENALQNRGTVIVHDQAGLTHVAVPLLLGKQPLGAIIAGQVFDRYPEQLPLQRVAKEFGVPAHQLWDLSKKQRPVSSATLKASGDLLCALGQAFLRQRYGAILEAKLAETNGRFRLLVEGVRDYALFTMDRAGQVTSWNRGAERMLGYVEPEIVGRNFSCIFAEEDNQQSLPQQHLQMALDAGRMEDQGWRVRSDRTRFWANVNITRLLEDTGSVRGFAIVMQDATERRKVAMVLEEARKERARLQENFLSHVSHELRTPLTAIYFFVTNVLDGLVGALTSAQHEHLGFALDNIQQLKDMVSDLLDITRVETHKLTIEPRHLSPAKLIAEAVSTCRTNAAAKKISLRSEIAPSLPFIWADPARTLQILINLIDNGIKFTPASGTILIESQPLAGDDFLCFSVSDTGRGIGPDDLEKVFDRLAQVKSSVEASRSGLGLGLFIARELVIRHGGRIWLESQLGRGSTFYFTLPVFSLAKLCTPIFTASNLEAGSLTVIAVDVDTIAGVVQTDILSVVRGVLERCIHPCQDLLLPSMDDEEPVKTFFIVACTDAIGFEVIAARIVRELKKFDTASRLKPVISSTTLLVGRLPSRQEQIEEIAKRIESVVQFHLFGREKFK
jgi:PAS domain S-box-containing protein